MDVNPRQQARTLLRPLFERPLSPAERAVTAAVECRIAELDAALRRAIHLIETTRPYVVWTREPELEEIYTEEWASTSLERLRDALEWG